jgi:hypothetical protein
MMARLVSVSADVTSMLRKSLVAGNHNAAGPNESRQSSIPRMYSMRDRPFVGDQKCGDSSLQGLLHEIPRSLAGPDRLVNRDAEIWRGVDQLAVLRGDRG